MAWSWSATCERVVLAGRSSVARSRGVCTGLIGHQLFLLMLFPASANACLRNQLPVSGVEERAEVVLARDAEILHVLNHRLRAPARDVVKQEDLQRSPHRMREWAAALFAVLAGAA